MLGPSVVNKTLHCLQIKKTKMYFKITSTTVGLPRCSNSCNKSSIVLTSFIANKTDEGTCKKTEYK